MALYCYLLEAGVVKGRHLPLIFKHLNQGLLEAGAVLSDLPVVNDCNLYITSRSTFGHS